MPILIIAALAFMLAGCVANKSLVASSDIGRRTVILGDLGRPIGEEVTIHGRTQTPNIYNGGASFLVDSVDGQKLERSVALNVRGITGWVVGTEATIRGYEVGDIRFEHIDDLNFGPDDPRFKTHQVIWMSFEPLEIIAPKNLKIGT
jgi:hypothetical protein